MTTEIPFDELVFYKENDKIMSGGFSVNSILMQKGEAPMITKNTGSPNFGGHVSHIFNDLAVPSGVLYVIDKHHASMDTTRDKVINNDKVLGNDIHDKLLKMIEVNSDNSLIKTRRSKVKIVKKKSRRHLKK
jgi:hypothetical protein